MFITHLRQVDHSLETDSSLTWARLVKNFSAMLRRKRYSPSRAVNRVWTLSNSLTRSSLWPRVLPFSDNNSAVFNNFSVSSSAFYTHHTYTHTSITVIIAAAVYGSSKFLLNLAVKRVDAGSVKLLKSQNFVWALGIKQLLKVMKANTLCCFTSVSLHLAFFNCPSVYLCVCLSVRTSVCPSVCLSVCLSSVRLSLCLCDLRFCHVQIAL